MQNWTFNINFPTHNASIATNKIFIFKLNIEDYFKNYFGLIRSKFLSLSLIKSVSFFWDTRYIPFDSLTIRFVATLPPKTIWTVTFKSCLAFPKDVSACSTIHTRFVFTWYVFLGAILSSEVVSTFAMVAILVINT